MLLDRLGMIFSDRIFFYNVIVEMLVNPSKELPLNYRGNIFSLKQIGFVDYYCNFQTLERSLFAKILD